MARIHTRFIAALSCLGLALTATPALAQSRAGTDHAVASLVDAHPAPTLVWDSCGEAQCATATLPMDYARPEGDTVSVALTKIPATKPAERIGTLFVNPGGPGAPGTDWVASRVDLFAPDLRQRFDIVGFDPRGTNASTRLVCFDSPRRQAEVYQPLTSGFPITRREEAQYRHAARRLARECADEPLARHMSTTDVARDLEMLRRAVGDERLTFIGFSYGTYLGQVYAGMYPDRVRAIVLDGVVDGEAWRGTPATAQTPMPLRMGNALGASSALEELMRRCRQAGDSCPLADPKKDLQHITSSLRRAPLQISEGGETYEITYADFVEELLYSLYSPDGEAAIEVIAGTKQLFAQPARTETARTSPRGFSATGETDEASTEAGTDAAELDGQHEQINDLELNAAVVCSDSHHPRGSQPWSRLADHADRVAPYFGRPALWSSIACADWAAKDVDAFAGSFAVDAPVLVVGARWDPATSHAAARRVAGRLSRSTFVSSNNWGHTTYGESACADRAVNTFLLTASSSRRSITCTDGAQPFQG